MVLKLLRRIIKCKIVMINLDEVKQPVMRSELLKPNTYYRQKVRIS